MQNAGVYCWGGQTYVALNLNLTTGWPILSSNQAFAIAVSESL